VSVSGRDLSQRIDMALTLRRARRSNAAPSGLSMRPGTAAALPSRR